MCCWILLQFWLCLPSYGLEDVVGHGVVWKIVCVGEQYGNGTLHPKHTTHINPGRADSVAVATF